MTKETLEKANELLNKLEEHKNNLKLIKNSVPLKYPGPEESLETYYIFQYNAQNPITIPKCLCVSILEMIKKEYEVIILELQKEFNEI